MSKKLKYIVRGITLTLAISLIGFDIGKYFNTNKSNIVKAINKTSNDNNTLLYNENKIFSLKNQNNIPKNINDAINRLNKQAEKKLKIKNPTVIDKTEIINQGATKHDYVSMPPYYWKNPNTKTGYPYIVKDGVKNPERFLDEKFDSERAEEMISAVTTLSTAYCLTRKEEYAKKASEIIKTWFINKDTKMNPNMTYSQCIPGKNKGTGSGIINSSNFIKVIDSVYLLQNSNSWTSEDDKNLKKWFEHYINWLETSELGKLEKGKNTNHGSWYDAQVATYALYCGKDKLAKKIVKEAKEKRIDKQIESDGSMPAELRRTKSLPYTQYNLQALITLARVGDKVQINLWDYKGTKGQSLKTSIDFVNDYLLGKITWKYKNITKEENEGLMPYLALAYNHYNSNDYKKIIENYEDKLNEQQKIILFTIMNS